MYNLDELKLYYKELKELKLYFDNKQNKTKKERKKKKLFLYSNKNFNKIIIYVILINLLFLLF